MAAHCIWMPSQTGTFLFLQRQTVSHLCQMYRRVGRHCHRQSFLRHGTSKASHCCPVADSTDGGRFHTGADFLYQYQWQAFSYRAAFWIRTDHSVFVQRGADIFIWVLFLRPIIQIHNTNSNRCYTSGRSFPGA